MAGKAGDPTDRGPGRPRGTKVSEAQRAAGKANIVKAHEARAKRKEARKQEEEKPRWKQLEDGDINVRDLTDKELVRGQCANNDGSWEGKRHALPQRLIQAMTAESTRRARSGVDRLAKPALVALKRRLEDDDAPAQQFAAARMVLEYKIGKVPDVVHHGVETEYDRLAQTAFTIRRGPDLAEELALNSGRANSDDHGDVVDAELVEDEG